MILVFEVPGVPVGKGRARSFVRAGKIGHYTPQRTREYQWSVTAAAIEAMKGAKPFSVPLAVTLEARMPVPASWTKGKRRDALAGLVGATCKPDADNVIKAGLDACNGIVWKDDCYITTLMVQKVYAEVPLLYVMVQTVDNARAAQA